MNKKVSLREIVADKILFAVIFGVYYWMWARDDWKDYYTSMQYALSGFTICYILLRASRLRKFKKEEPDELANINIKRCDSICLKIVVVALVILAFVCAICRFVLTTELIGYCIVTLLFMISIVRTVIFTIMDSKGV